MTDHLIAFGQSLSGMVTTAKMLGDTGREVGLQKRSFLRKKEIAEWLLYTLPSLLDTYFRCARRWRNGGNGDEPIAVMKNEVNADPGDDDLLYRDNVFVTGEVDLTLQRQVVDRLRELREEKETAIIEITTNGGDADAGRRIACEIGLFREKSSSTIYVIGRTTVYSAGVTIFVAVPPSQRFLTSDTMLLVHERRESRRPLNLDGPTSICIQMLEEELASLKAGARLEQDGFENFVRGSRLDVAELRKHASQNWYISAQEALGFGLVKRIIVCRHDSCQKL